MRTVFICKSFNIRLEGVDPRRYKVNDRVHIKYQGRWIPMVIEGIVEEGGVRKILLSPLEPLLYGSYPSGGTSSPSYSHWIDEFVSAIEGKKGSVIW